jgi:hypothetical protein
MTPQRTRSRVPLLAGAGAAVVYVAAQWGGAASGSQDGGSVQVVEAATRPAAGQAPTAATTVAMAAPTTGSTPPSASPAPSASATGVPTLHVLRNRVLPDDSGNPFATLSWLPPPPPPAKPVAPPPPPPPAPPAEPVAPPLPFTFVGLVERGGAKPAAFLSRGENLLMVSVGDMLEHNIYRVDAVNANEIVMTYMPLKTAQILSVSGRAR